MNERIQEIKGRHAAATPGPWYWHGYLKSKDVDLVSETSGHPTVMGFRRWGMSGAAPAFNEDGAMERIDYGMIETRKPHVSEFYKIDHPDADLIKNSWSDVSYLLSEVERLQTALYTHQSYDKTAGELHVENQILISALKWYANKGNYDPSHLEASGRIPIGTDEGRRARAALSKVGVKE